MTVAYEYGKSIRKPSFIFSPWIEKKIWATLEDGIHHLSVHLNDYKPSYCLTKEKSLKTTLSLCTENLNPIYLKINCFLFLIETVPMERLKAQSPFRTEQSGALIITYNREHII
jgi:heptosyltransferase-2